MHIFIPITFLFAINLQTVHLAPYSRESSKRGSYIASTEEELKRGYPTKERVEYWTKVIDTIFKKEIRPPRKEAIQQAEEKLRKELKLTSASKKYSVLLFKEEEEEKDQNDDEMPLEEAQKVMLSEKSKTDWFAMMEARIIKLEKRIAAYEKSRSENPMVVHDAKVEQDYLEWNLMGQKYPDFRAIMIFW